MRRSTWLASVLLVLGCGAARPPAEQPDRPLDVSVAEAEAAARDLARHVDPQLGVVVVEDIDDARGETSPRRRATLRCGDDVTALATALSTYLAQRPEGSPTWSCTGHDCELPGAMEYDPNRILRFGHDRDGRTIVRGYFAIDALLVEPERLGRTRENADRDFEELRAQRCP